MTQWIDSNIIQWVESNDPQWGILGEVILYQIWTDYDYVYAAIETGLDIYDIESELKYAYVTYSGGFSTVWANNDYVFIGTTDSGVKYLSKTKISGSISYPIDLSVHLSSLSDLTFYSPGSDDILYLHGNSDKLLCITPAGVDVIKINPQSYKSCTTISGAKKGFITSTGTFYYTVSGTTNWSLNRVNTCLFDWGAPDYSYTTSGVLATGISINDIFATENTAHDGVSNTLFVATSSGVYVIDEGSDEYIIYYKE